jgi:hypothetical protein
MTPLNSVSNPGISEEEEEDQEEEEEEDQEEEEENHGECDCYLLPK